MLPKSQRVSKDASTIVLTNPSLGEQIDNALEYAISVWEASILGCDSILIEVEVADIEEDIRTYVNYDYMKGNNVYIPRSLNAFQLQLTERDTTYPDGIITISSNTKWDYSLNENISPDCKSLTYGLMRAVARILGFGSSIGIDDSDNYYFQCRRSHSVFDKLIFNSSGIGLTSVSANGGKPNPSLKSYANEPNQTFWVNTNKGQYKLQSPPYTINTLPFVFLNDNNSLMSGTLNTGNYVLQVDNATQTILNELGWNIIPTCPIKITSSDIPDSGLASAYKTHQFKIESNNPSIRNPKWEFIMPLANGQTQSIFPTDNGFSCTIAPITNENIYKINADGDIECRMQFSCSINGKEVHAQPFNVHLELKPFIEYASIEKIIDNSPLASYNAHFKVKYRGTDQITVSVEEEYSSILKTQIIKEPYIAYGVAEYITAPYYAWIDFTAENKYGKSTYTIELEPNGTISKKQEKKPVKPQISDITFDYTYDWEYDDIWPNGKFSFLVKADGATSFKLYWSESFLFSPPKNFRFGEDIEGINEVRIDFDADWGEYLTVAAGNQFGYSHSDIICTTDYITDPDVRKRIEELKQQAGITGTNLTPSTMKTTWDNNILTFSSPAYHVAVYNITGNLVMPPTTSQSLDLSHLPGGTYIIRYASHRNPNSMPTTIKIFKR